MDDPIPWAITSLCLAVLWLLLRLAHLSREGREERRRLRERQHALALEVGALRLDGSRRCPQCNAATRGRFCHRCGAGAG